MHDIHIHTSLSSCSSTDLALYVPEIRKRKYAAVGFANHVWDSAVPGASDWYRPQDVAHVLKLREELGRYDFGDTKVYLGCEAEYIGGGVVGLDPRNAPLFDYVLVSAHHFHMAGFTRPADLADPGEVRKLMLKRFLEVCDIGFAFGIVHPFLPMGYMDSALEILRGIEDKEFRTCFRYAAERKKSIEINLSVFRKFTEAELSEYRRMMTIARECGCCFHTGSDAHTVESFNPEQIVIGERFASDCGITLPENPLA